jgi:DNA-binding LacI/PurR family transcriptional regulator
MKRFKPTITQVAARAGVSVGTVSHVLNGKPHVSPKTRERVLKVLREMHYLPNGVARSLRMRKTYILALVVLDLSNPFYPEVIKGVENTARAYGYKVVVFDTGYDPRKERSFIETMLEMRVDGALFTAGSGDRAGILRLHRSGVPVVILDRSLQEFPLPSVGIDNLTAVRDAITYLLRMGHRRIGYLSEPISIHTVRDRFDGYLQALETFGVPFDPSIVFIDKSLQVGKIERGYEVMRRVISTLSELPTAFFATSDTIAIGAMKALKETGFRIPEDVSVMGFDDISLAAFTDPPLTTVRQHKYEMGAQAVHLLMRFLRDPRARGEKILLPTELIERASVRPPGQAKEAGDGGPPRAQGHHEGLPRRRRALTR